MERLHWISHSARGVLPRMMDRVFLAAPDGLYGVRIAIFLQLALEPTRALARQCEISASSMWTANAANRGPPRRTRNRSPRTFHPGQNLDFMPHARLNMG